MEFREACDLRRKGWINIDGSVNESIRTKYDEIEGLSDQINDCLNPEMRQIKGNTCKNQLIHFFVQGVFFHSYSGMGQL